MRIDAYIRVSDVHGREGPSFISPEVQRQKIEDWAKLHDHEIAAVFDELDVSGGKMDRPKLAEVMRRIETGESEGVVVWKLDRFGRTLIGALEHIRRINAKGALFASVSDDFDITTPTGRFVLKMMLSLAELELERIGENWLEARTRAVRRGAHMGYGPPFGYVKRPADGCLAPDPEAAPIVKEVFRRRAAGAQVSVIRAWLNDSGVKTTLGRRWRDSSVAVMLRNEIYRGVLSNGAAGRNEHAHTPLVDAETWAIVQSRHSVRPNYKPQDGLLTGLLRCAGCRYCMRYNGSFEKSRPEAGYQCIRVSVGDRCPAPANMQARDSTYRDYRGIEEWVVEQVWKRTDDVAYAPGSDEVDIDALESAVRITEADLVQYRDDRELEDALGREHYLGGITTRREAVVQAQQALDDARLRQGVAVPEHIRRLRERWDDLTIAERRDALSMVIKTIFCAKKGTYGNGASHSRVHIVWADDPAGAELDLPRQGRRDYTATPFVFPEPHPNGAGVVVA
jgi:DNA invertase Pin-like site-specific DNA recombinase